MDEADTKRLEQAVEEYCRRYCISPAFEISDLYELTAENWRSTTLPFSTHTGCYVFYSENIKIIYIGKASMRHDLGTRITRYFTNKPEFKPVDTGWSVLSRYVQAIKVHEAFEAPSLEEYLIRELKPEGNKLGVWRDREA